LVDAAAQGHSGRRQPLSPEVQPMTRTALLALGLCSLAGGAPRADDVEARIRRVESGLLPAVALSAAPPQTFSILERMRLYNVPGLSVAVIDGGRVDWARGYGVLERGGEAAVDADTLFQAASISKPVVATLALRSVEMGVVELDRPLNDQLKTWKIPENELTRKTPPTLRHLLAHRAGLTVHGFRGYTEGEEVPSVYQILDGVKPANSAAVRVDIPPDTAFRYSGGGYVLLQLLLTERHGQPLRELVRTHVLEPAGMTRSALAYPLDTELRLNAASGHRASGEVVKGKYRVHPEIGAGGLWTTPTDLCRWAMAIQRSYRGEPGSLLRQETAREMLTPVDGRGLGPVVRVEPEGVVFSHDGSNAGYFCRLVAYADRGQGVAVMLNGDDATIVGELVRAVAREYGWPHFQVRVKTPVDLAPDRLARFAGRYRLGPMEVEIKLDEGRLVAVLPDGRVQRLHAQSETEVFNVEDDIVLRFEFGEGGLVRGASASVGDKAPAELEIVRR
jgi:CubicO group peptidase (beta-lactamase class C family)